MKKLTAICLSAVASIAISAFAANAEDFKIGLSNGWVGSEWRTQMIDEAQAAAEPGRKRASMSRSWSRAPMSTCRARSAPSAT